MFSTPRKGGWPYSYGSPSQKLPLKGLFKDGVWHCNCDPRLPASHFVVRKEGRNKGRGFYTCQEPKEKGCGFFLWQDQAAGREMQAVISNSRTEPDAEALADEAEEAAADTFLQRPGGKVNKMTVEGHIEASNSSGWMVGFGKKGLGAIGRSVDGDQTLDNNAQEDEFGDWPLSMEDELQVVKALERTEKSAIPPETPRKSVKFSEISTPHSKRKFDEIHQYPTPQTRDSKGDDVFWTPSTTKQHDVMWDSQEKIGSGLMSPLTSPTPTRFRDSRSQESTEMSPEKGDYDITQEVMELLKDQFLDEEITTNVRKILNKYALKNQGIAKGRDISRLALKTKDAKIAELQERNKSLETEREMDKVVIRHFKADMAQSVSNRHGRGRGRGS